MDEDSIKELFLGISDLDAHLSAMKAQLVKNNGSKKSQDTGKPQRNIMTIDLPKPILSKTTQWNYNKVDVNGQSLLETLDGVTFIKGHLIVCWSKVEDNTGTLNRSTITPPCPTEPYPGYAHGNGQYYPAQPVVQPVAQPAGVLGQG